MDVEKQRNKLCFTSCDHVPFSKGKKGTQFNFNTYALVTLKFFFSFFPIVAILSGTWAAGIALGKSSVPACTLLWQPKGSVCEQPWRPTWKILQRVKSFMFPHTHGRAHGSQCRRCSVTTLVGLVNTGYQTDWHSSAIKQQQCINPPHILWQYFINDPRQRPDYLSEI